MPARTSISLRVLVVAPTAGDGAAICSTLAGKGLEARAIADLAELARIAQDEGGAILLAQEAPDGDGVELLRTLLSKQPPWSDVPLIILTLGGDAAQDSARSLVLFGPAANVTLLERPCSPATLQSAVQVALKARQKQYDVRDLLTHLDERTRELSRSNADLEQFAYVTSHDLQEPLRMITSYLGLLERRLGEALDPRAREYLAYAVDGAGRMRTMIDAVLQYARIERNDDPGDEIDAGEAVSEALDNLREEIARSGARITVAAMPRVLANRSLLAKVFQNLLANAIKFRGEAAPSIAIAVEEQDEAWVFSVSDNGIGFAPEQRERLFKLFQRLHGHDAYPGTGIGLATCRRIVERRGGRIWAESTPGAGATFRFTLPHARVTTTAIRRPQSAQASIMMVDDNPGDIELLQEVFREHADEVEVSGVIGGSALIEQLSRRDRSHLPSALLIDLNMPGMDGKAVLSFLKSHPIYRGIPAVMYSSSMRQAERQQCLQLGADDYIVKPATLKDCESVVDRLRELLRSE